MRDKIGDPVLQQPALIQSDIGEGDAHAEAGVHVDDFGLARERAAISNNAHVDERAVWEWTERINIATAEADF